MSAVRLQRTDWNCALCPLDNFPSFPTAHAMREHAAAVHDLPLEQTERLLRRAVAFLDGSRGSAQQIFNWVLPDDRVFCTQVWSAGMFCETDAPVPKRQRKEKS